MYDFYEEECYYEPTEADEIFDKAKDELESALKNSVKYGFKRVIDKNKELVEQNKLLNDRLKNIDKEKHELKTLRKSILEDARKDMERDFCQGFRPGDVVWRTDAKSSLVECPTCKGKKKHKIVIFDIESEVECPTCKGNGHVRTYTYSPKKSIVTSVSFSINSEDSWSYKQLTRRHVKYWLDRGDWDISGTRAEKEFFRTEEECKVECVKQEQQQQYK